MPTARKSKKPKQNTPIVHKKTLNAKNQLFSLSIHTPIIFSKVKYPTDIPTSIIMWYNTPAKN